MGAGKGVEAGAPYVRHRVSGAVQLATKPVSLTGEYMYGKDAGSWDRGLTSPLWHI